MIYWWCRWALAVDVHGTIGFRSRGVPMVIQRNKDRTGLALSFNTAAIESVSWRKSTTKSLRKSRRPWSHALNIYFTMMVFKTKLTLLVDDLTIIYNEGFAVNNDVHDFRAGMNRYYDSWRMMMDDLTRLSRISDLIYRRHYPNSVLQVIR